MRSLVNWALLGLIIDRPSYGYELAKRFSRTYEGVLSITSLSHIYLALGVLKDRGLIEVLPGTRDQRQPKPRYRVTDVGLSKYADWLVEQLSEDRQRESLLVLQLGALAREPDRALAVIDRMEEACLAAASRAPSGDGPTGGAQRVVVRLLSEGERLSLAAKLTWIQYARKELRAAANASDTAS